MQQDQTDQVMDGVANTQGNPGEQAPVIAS